MVKLGIFWMLLLYTLHSTLYSLHLQHNLKSDILEWRGEGPDEFHNIFDLPQRKIKETFYVH